MLQLVRENWLSMNRSAVTFFFDSMARDLPVHV